eukprot:Polyplicarium_translucidae@DN2682_c0_g1_i2.p1
MRRLRRTVDGHLLTREQCELLWVNGGTSKVHRSVQGLPTQGSERSDSIDAKCCSAECDNLSDGQTNAGLCKKCYEFTKCFVQNTMKLRRSWHDSLDIVNKFKRSTKNEKEKMKLAFEEVGHQHPGGSVEFLASQKPAPVLAKRRASVVAKQRASVAVPTLSASDVEVVWKGLSDVLPAGTRVGLLSENFDGTPLSVLADVGRFARRSPRNSSGVKLSLANEAKVLAGKKPGEKECFEFEPELSASSMVVFHALDGARKIQLMELASAEADAEPSSSRSGSFTTMDGMSSNWSMGASTSASEELAGDAVAAVYADAMGALHTCTSAQLSRLAFRPGGLSKLRYISLQPETSSFYEADLKDDIALDGVDDLISSAATKAFTKPSAQNEKKFQIRAQLVYFTFALRYGLHAVPRSTLVDLGKLHQKRKFDTLEPGVLMDHLWQMASEVLNIKPPCEFFWKRDEDLVARLKTTSVMASLKEHAQ